MKTADACFHCHTRWLLSLVATSLPYDPVFCMNTIVLPSKDAGKQPLPHSAGEELLSESRRYANALYLCTTLLACSHTLTQQLLLGISFCML